MRNHHNHCLSHKRQVLLGDVGGGDDDVADESVGGNKVNMTIQYSHWEVTDRDTTNLDQDSMRQRTIITS